MFSEYNAAATRIQASSLKAAISALLFRKEPVRTVNAIDTMKNLVLMVDIGAGRGQLLKEFAESDRILWAERSQRIYRR